MSAAADILQILAQQPDLSVIADVGTALLNFLPVHKHPARKNHGLGAFPGGHQAALHQQLVNSQLHLELSWKKLIFLLHSHPTMCKEPNAYSLLGLIEATLAFSTLFFTQLLKTRKHSLEIILQRWTATAHRHCRDAQTHRDPMAAHLQGKSPYAHKVEQPIY